MLLAITRTHNLADTLREMGIRCYAIAHNDREAELRVLHDVFVTSIWVTPEVSDAALIAQARKVSGITA